MLKHITMKRVGWALVLLGAVLIVIWGFRLVGTGLSLFDHLRRAQAMADEPDTLDPGAACDLMQGVRGDVVKLRRQAGWLAHLGPALGWLPKVGGEMKAAPHLLMVADGLTEAGALSCEAMEPALAALDGGNSFSPKKVLRPLDTGQDELEQALMAVEEAQAAWAHVDINAFSPQLADKMALLDQGLPLLGAGLNAATIAPDLLGMDAPRTYLVLALNEDELRPGGGFISGVGEVHVEAGQLITMTFRDSYAADDFSEPYPAPPEPMQRYMGIELWIFRDSNWSPDFPTAAQQAISLYRPGYPVSIDGVIALDQEAVKGLVGAIGPLEVGGAEEPITGKTILPYIQQAWAPGEEVDAEWWSQRKSFMGTIARATWKKLESGQVDWVALGRSLLRLLEQKHVLAYIPDPRMEAILAEQGWDGALRPEDDDFLMVVDANMGYNKASAKVQQEINYQVDLRQSPPQARLTLVYTHTSTADVPCYPESRYASTYEGMMNRCYWDYLRVYIPQGSQLLDATRIAIPGELLWSGEPDSGTVEAQAVPEQSLLALGVMNVLPPATTQTRYMSWALPDEVIHWHNDEGTYTLRVQKQPGARDHALIVRVRLPEQSTLLDTTPKPSSIGKGEKDVVYRMLLDQDREITLHFRRKE